jgi:hypothetical protein
LTGRVLVPRWMITSGGPSSSSSPSSSSPTTTPQPPPWSSIFVELCRGAGFWWRKREGEDGARDGTCKSCRQRVIVDKNNNLTWVAFLRFVLPKSDLGGSICSGLAPIDFEDLDKRDRAHREQERECLWRAAEAVRVARQAASITRANAAPGAPPVKTLEEVSTGAGGSGAAA